MNDASELLPAYFQLMNCNGAAHVYREALRSGVLEALGSDARPAAAVAEQCGTAPRPTELVLEALVVLELATKSEGGYRTTPLALLLLAGSYRNLGDEYWAHLPALLKTGEPAVRMDDAATNEAHYQAQAAVLGWMLAPAARCAADILAESLPPNAAILDLGAGSGSWSLTLASRSAGTSVTAVDWPSVLEVTQEMARDRGLAERLTTIAGNFHEVELPAQAFDLAIVANVVHLMTPAAIAALLRKARAALAPRGRIAMVDVFSGQPQGDLNRALYAVGLALRTAHGRVYDVEALRPLLLESGFGEPRCEPLPVPPYVVGMLVADVV